MRIIKVISVNSLYESGSFSHAFTLPCGTVPWMIVSINMQDDLLKDIDARRGDVPRSRFIVRRLEDALKSEVRKK
jgi:hypothetical protein